MGPLPALKPYSIKVSSSAVTSPGKNYTTQDQPQITPFIIETGIFQYKETDVTAETILVVEHQTDLFKFITQTILHPNGYKTLRAANGLEAMSLALSKPVNLIICSLDLPQTGSGLDLLKNLHEAGSKIPVILTTAAPTGDSAQQAFKWHAQDYLVQPFSAAEMTEAIQRALHPLHLQQNYDHLAVTHNQLNQQLQQITHQLPLLQSIGETIVTTPGLAETLNRVVEITATLTGAEECSIMLLNPQGELHLQAAFGLTQQSEQEFYIKVQDSIVGQVLSTGKPVIIGGQDEYESFKVKTSYFVKSLINVPVFLNQQVIGVLAINNKINAESFTPYHAELLSIIATFIAIAIQHHQQYPATAPQTKPSPAERTRVQQLEMLTNLGHLASGIANELTPSVNALINHTVSLTNILSDIPAVHPIVTAISHETVHCRQIVDQLLEFSGQEPALKTAISIQTPLESAWEQLKPQSEAKNIAVIYNYALDLPLIEADQHQLEQAFFYILHSALQALTQGGTLRIITRTLNNTVQVIISDTGIIIPSGKVRYIFDPFHQTTRHTFGLGLSISHSIIERHNGFIEVASRPGSGTTFTIHLPVITPDL